ncbi:NUDIX hydrolase [Peredibacter sp. HCB2-198]|uniref:NUDIX hydrolase n=1 Tax=Peredibacter sp. HCB2-198 TaxID=3383025 RepID=UPI0038B52ACE
MKLLPVALAIFYRQLPGNVLEVWTQVREDDGPYHGLLEFPGGKIEPGEEPVMGAVREVQEEVGIDVDSRSGRFMGIYTNPLSNKTILLYVFLFPDQPSLIGKGQWLKVENPDLSRPFTGQIPSPNHQIIDDLYRALYDRAHE